MNYGIEIALVFFYFLILALTIQRYSFFKIKSLPKNFILYVFILKVLTGVLLAVIYTHFYSNRSEADIFKYFDDSKYMTDALWEKPVDFFKMLFGIGNDTDYFTQEYYGKMNNWFRQYESNIYNDSHTVIRFNAVVRIFSFGFYHVHTLVICFLSLIGLTAMFHAFSGFFKNKERMLALVIFLLPSVLFWSSGVLKEGLLVFGLGTLIYCTFELLKKNVKWYYFPLLFISFALLLFLKIYALLLLIPCLISYWLIRKLNYRWILPIYAGTLIVAIVAALSVQYVKEDYNILEIIAHKQHDFINHAKHLGSGSRLDFEPIEPTVISFIKSSPLSFLVTFFRPFFFESMNPMMILAGLENLFLFLLVVFAFLKPMKLDNEQKNLLYLLIFYGVLMFTLVGMVTPVMGAIVRYKVPALGMFAAAFVLLGDWKSILNNYPTLKKLFKI